VDECVGRNDSALERRKSKGALTGKKVKVQPPRRRTIAPAERPSFDSAMALRPSFITLRASQVGRKGIASLFGSMRRRTT
jgi:hypothetical protein